MWLYLLLNGCIKKAKRIGLYENFGENEIKHIEDKFIDISDYSDLMNAKRSALNEFMNWCYNYSG